MNLDWRLDVDHALRSRRLNRLPGHAAFAAGFLVLVTGSVFLLSYWPDWFELYSRILLLIGSVFAALVVFTGRIYNELSSGGWIRLRIRVRVVLIIVLVASMCMVASFHVAGWRQARGAHDFNRTLDKAIASLEKLDTHVGSAEKRIADLEKRVPELTENLGAQIQRLGDVTDKLDHTLEQIAKDTHTMYTALYGDPQARDSKGFFVSEHDQLAGLHDTTDALDQDFKGLNDKLGDWSTSDTRSLLTKLQMLTNLIGAPSERRDVKATESAKTSGGAGAVSSATSLSEELEGVRKEVGALRQQLQEAAKQVGMGSGSSGSGSGIGDGSADGRGSGGSAGSAATGGSATGSAHALQRD